MYRGKADPLDAENRDDSAKRRTRSEQVPDYKITWTPGTNEGNVRS